MAALSSASRLTYKQALEEQADLEMYGETPNSTDGQLNQSHQISSG